MRQVLGTGARRTVSVAALRADSSTVETTQLAIEMTLKDTIFALATPYGKSGVAIIRLSGPDSLAALEALSGHDAWTPNMAQRVDLRASGEVIDRAIGLYFKAPKSFTGEDVVELHIHGGLAIIRQLLEILSGMDGLRHAEPGEFTRRAYLNGKMDLIEAEGLADLIDAETPRQKMQALKQMGGDISRHYDEMRGQLIRALAQLEAYIDFPDEEIPASVLKAVEGEVTALKSTIAATLSDHGRGERLREGIRIVILGAPNAGKSSLLNRLAGREAAIVSHRAGTTRDVIEVHMDIAGFPVILTDTAGLREAVDEIEEEGIRRALAKAEEADIRLLLIDGSLPDSTSHFIEISKSDILIINKSDSLNIDLNLPENSILLSTLTTEGIDNLILEIEKKLSFIYSEPATITRARHRELLIKALESLEGFSVHSPLELACEELRLAAVSIGKITGKIAVDELLDVVFRQFCIGK